MAEGYATAVEKFQGLEGLPEEQSCELYALHQQAEHGDAPAECPADTCKTDACHAKHNAWAALKGVSCDDAKKQFVDKLSSL